MRASLLSPIASTAILVTIMLQFPEDHIASPAYAATSANENVTLPLVQPVTQVKRSQRIAFKDLDLASSGGQASLQVRVRSAAKKVCGPRGYSRSEKLDIAQCELDTLARAMPKVERSITRAQISEW